MPRLRARIAAWLVEPPDLGDDPGDRQVAQAHRLAGQDLVRHQDHRLVAVARLAGAVIRHDRDRLAGQVRADPQDHVADVGHPLAEIAPARSGRTARHSSA